MYDISFQVNKHLYPVQALIKTAYAFIDVCYIHLDEQDGNWTISMTQKEPFESPEVIKDQFENELILQTVRLSVYRQTHIIRELLLARAISSSMMVDTRKGLTDYRENNISSSDLKDILTDWFEKND